MAKLKHLIRKPDTRPKWSEIQAGPAATCSLYACPTTRMFKSMITGDYDDFFWDYLSQYELRGTTIIDIGAHIGYHSLCFAQLVGETGFVHAFEPNTINFDRFTLLCEKNQLAQRIITNRVALADKPGTALFHFSTNIENETSSGGYLHDSHTPFGPDVYKKAGFIEAKVPLDTLDAYAQSHPLRRVSLIKIDVEGAEHEVLRGGIETIKAHRPVMLIEIHSVVCMMHVARLLTELGYTMRVLDDEDAKAGRGRCFIAAEPQPA